MRSCGQIRAVTDEATKTTTYPLSFSSEMPYERAYGIEILSHKDGAVNLMRLQEIGVVLFNHNRNQVIGKIVTVGIENNRGVATVEFDDDDFSQMIKHKIDKGTLKTTSVGYSIDEYVTKELDKKRVELTATKWTPYEISIVSLPADATVGVGRDFESNVNINDIIKPLQNLNQYQIKVNKNKLKGD